MLNTNNFLYVKLESEQFPDIRLDHFGWQKSDPDNKNLASIKHVHILHLVLSGKGTYCAGNKKYELKANDAFLINPAERVNYYPDADDPWEYLWFGFSGKDAASTMRRIGFTDNSPVMSFYTFDEPKNIFDCLKPIYEKGICPNDDIRIAGKTYDLIYALIKQNKIHSISDPEPIDDPVKNAVHIINECYSEQLTVSELSRRLYIDRTTLYKLFKSNFGVSPQIYILKYRLMIAQEFIVATDIPFKVIAANCGFVNYPHFLKSYERYYNTTPSQARKNYGKTPNKQNTAPPRV